MARIIVTADVEDGAAWDAKFRTRGELMKRAGLRAVHYTVTDNRLVSYVEPEDAEAYLKFMGSSAVADAMREDGIKRETVRIYVLDRELLS
jgi:hypothetical protein